MLYVLAIDTYAIHKGIWRISDEFTTGISAFGIVSLEHLLIYTLTTALASETMLAFLRFAEIYHAVRKENGASLLSVVLGIW